MIEMGIFRRYRFKEVFPCGYTHEQEYVCLGVFADKYEFSYLGCPMHGSNCSRDVTQEGKKVERCTNFQS